jgi:hypothetical protein
VITAVDSSVLIDILSGDPRFGPRSRAAFMDAHDRGGVIACDVVWAEVARSAPSPDDAVHVLDRMGVDFAASTRQAALIAGRSLAGYRRTGGSRGRILPDFLIGAHALLHADRLLTRDRGFYRRYFAELVVTDPSRY